MKIIQSVSIKLQNLWDKTRNKKKVKTMEFILWFLLFFFELIYRLFFYFINSIKLLKKPYKAPFPVISVGNISLGGTGKSVFVRFLIQQLSGTSAVLLRGHGGINVSTNRSLMVGDGQRIFVDAKQSGDEAYMLALTGNGPVVVGKNRADSCKLLEQYVAREHVSINQIILDDAYQHHTLHKNLEIVLLDARYPFENGHCIPAGRLREKDVSRAGLIILTHADKITSKMLQVTRNSIVKKTSSGVFVLAGKHQVEGVYFENEVPANEEVLRNPFFICAGIGSWTGFVASVEQAGVAVGAQKMFIDHHDYSLGDIESIIYEMRLCSLQYVITTEKDWVKIKPLLSSNQFHDKVFWYVLRIKFVFLSVSEQVCFTQLIETRIHE